MTRRTVLAGLLPLLLVLAVSARAQTEAQPELPKERLLIVGKDGKRHEFSVEVARTPDQQTVGLMFRPSVPEGGGMLFDWGAPRDSAMWMRNTVAPLDMLFINADGSIRRVAHDTVPFSLATVESRGPVRATLELAAGTAARLGIHAGDRVENPIFTKP